MVLASATVTDRSSVEHHKPSNTETQRKVSNFLFLHQDTYPQEINLSTLLGPINFNILIAMLSTRDAVFLSGKVNTVYFLILHLLKLS